MKSKACGLDIGSTIIKAVFLSPQRGGYLLRNAATCPTPEKGMLSESPLDQDEMARTIRKLFSDSKIPTKYVNVSFPERQVYTRVIDMPSLSDKELSSAIYWEAEQYIPVPLNTITLDYKVIKRPAKSEEGNMMQVLLVGAPTALIDKYERILGMAGLTISSAETEILSTQRAVVVGNNFPTSIILNIGAISTSIAIVKNGLIAFAYSIPTGGVAITRAIATDFGFSLMQAEEYKRAYGLSSENLGGKIGQAAQPVLELIMSEVKKALAFYNERYHDVDPIRQILLTGGTSKLPGLTTYFAANTSIETVVANPWKILVSQEVQKDIIDNAPEYTVAIGLALRDV